MTKPAIVVAGPGRCGSSLTMQMLHAGGIPCVGEWPDFEDERAGIPLNRPWFEGLHSVAVKRLDIHRDSTMPRSAIVIWLDRDHDQQAKSTLKLLKSQFSGISDNRQARRAIEASLARDAVTCKIAILKTHFPSMAVRFETLVSDPRGVVAIISAHIKYNAGYDLDQEKAITALIPRSPNCLPNMLEFDLLNQTRPT